MVVCPNCGQQNKDDFRFCQACGTPLAAAAAPPRPAAPVAQTSCPKCSATNPTGMKFCKDCGSPLEASMLAPPAPAPMPAPAPTPAPAAGPPPALSSVTCAGCSGETPAGFKFCQHCGAPLKPATAPALGTPPATILTPPKDPAPREAPPVQGADARTIVDVSARPLASHEASSPAAAPQRPATHTPPAGMPPGRAVAAPAPADPADLQTPVAGPADKTVGPGSGISGADVAAATQVLARLVTVNRDGSDGELHEIADTTYDVGRSEGHLVFEEDGYLSARHCRISAVDDAWRVIDLDSCNGVYLRITEPRPIESRDQMLIGKQVLRFERLDGEDEIAAAAEHGVLLFGSPLDDVWGRLKQITVAGVARNVYHLARPQVTLGREEGNITFPDDEFMSRKHMAVSFIDGKVIVQDLGSSNGTYVRVNGAAELTAGSMIRVGDQLLRFELV